MHYDLMSLDEIIAENFLPPIGEFVTNKKGAIHDHPPTAN